MPGVIDRLRGDLAEHPLFSGLDEDVRQAILRSCTVFHLDPGEPLYTAGGPATHVFVGLRGAIQIEYPKPDEQRGYVAAMLRAPFFVGECQVLHHRPWSGTAVALAPLTVLALSEGELELLVRERPIFAVAAYRELTLRFLRAIDAWKSRPTRTPAQEIARYVLGYLDVVRMESPEADAIDLRQADLGVATGLRRETVNRVLKQWAEDGYLAVAPSKLTQIDRAALQAQLHESDTVQLLQAIDVALD